MQVQVLGNRIMVEIVDVEQVGKVALAPGMEELDRSRFCVVDVGEGRLLENGTLVPIPLKAGDEVQVDIRVGPCLKLPPHMYGGKALMIVPMECVTNKVTREVGETIPRFRKAGLTAAGTEAVLSAVHKK